MAADFSRIKSRVTELLNACPSGTFSATIDPRNKSRNADAIEAACYEAALTVMSALASFPNEFRKNFVTVSGLTHGAMLPAHLGDPVSIEIQPYADAAWQEADVKTKNYLQIESYRRTTPGADNNIYDSIAHNEQGSSLSGYADVWEDKFYFTGYAARASLANAARADALTKIPDIFESTVIKLAIGNCPKLGDNAATFQIASYYAGQGMADLAEFKNGKRMFAEVSAPAPVTKVHQE